MGIPLQQWPEGGCCCQCSLQSCGTLCEALDCCPPCPPLEQLPLHFHSLSCTRLRLELLQERRAA